MPIERALFHRLPVTAAVKNPFSRILLRSNYKGALPRPVNAFLRVSASNAFSPETSWGGAGFSLPIRAKLGLRFLHALSAFDFPNSFSALISASRRLGVELTLTLAAPTDRSAPHWLPAPRSAHWAVAWGRPPYCNSLSTRRNPSGRRIRPGRRAPRSPRTARGC